ncbi:MAG: hypothetical protein ABEL76_16725, partial [Bradymonadaceae bacterium]
ASGTSDDGYTVWVDVEDGEIGELFEPEIEAGMISSDEDREERRRQIRERREGLKADDAVVVIREESEQEAWRDMESFCEYVEDDQFRELLDIARTVPRRVEPQGGREGPVARIQGSATSLASSRPARGRGVCDTSRRE